MEGRHQPELEDAVRKLQAEAAIFGVSVEVMMLAKLNAHFAARAQERQGLATRPARQTSAYPNGAPARKSVASR